MYNQRGKLIDKITNGNIVVKDYLGFKNDKIYFSAYSEDGLDVHLYSFSLKEKPKNAQKNITSNFPGFHKFKISPSVNFFIDEFSNLKLPRIVQVINEKGESLYVGFDKKPYVYSEGGESHGADFLTQLTNGGSAYSLPDTPTDSITVSMAGTDYVVVAHGGGYSYYSADTTVVDKTTDAKFLTFWDDRLWGIDSSGQLWYTLTIGGTPVNDALLPVQDGFVTDLFVGALIPGICLVFLYILWQLINSYLNPN